MTKPEIKFFKNGASIDMGIDGSGGVAFKVDGPFIANRMIIVIRDDTGNPTENSFGNATRLTNGLEFKFTDADGNVTDYTADQKIQCNLHWGILSGVDFETQVKGYAVRVTFNRMTGRGGFSIPSGAKLEWILNDSLVAVDEMFALLHGFTP